MNPAETLGTLWKFEIKWKPPQILWTRSKLRKLRLLKSDVEFMNTYYVTLESRLSYLSVETNWNTGQKNLIPFRNPKTCSCEAQYEYYAR